MQRRLNRIIAIIAVMMLSIINLCACTRNIVPRDTFHDDETILDDKYGSCYQVLIYSFCDSNGDGIGDFNGLTSKLDYIKDLGFTSLWLLPFTKANTYHKYDVVDYYTIDPQYGTMEDFEAFIAACDERNIKVYMDFVINHSSSKNEWFVKAQEYVSSLAWDAEIDVEECEYAGYYNFKRADVCPNGYAQLKDTDNWFYECVFDANMPDFNLDNEKLRAKIENIADFWINKGIDGFRLDAALHYVEGSEEESTRILKWFVDYVKSVNSQLYCVAEVWSTYAVLQQFYESGIDSLFNFSLGNKDGAIIKAVNQASNDKSGATLAEKVVKMYETFSDINPNYVDAVFLSNHDTGRSAGFLGRDMNSIKLAAALEMLQTGCVYVYYGEELGMVGSSSDENTRAPMYWTDEKVDYMTIGPPKYEKQEHTFGSYETQKEDPNSVYNYYRNAIHIRNVYPEIGRGRPALLDGVMEQNKNLYALSKKYEGNTVYMICNVSNEETTIEFSHDLYENYSELVVDAEQKIIVVDDKITIPPYGCIVMK